MNCFFANQERSPDYGRYHLKTVWMVDEDESYQVHHADRSSPDWVAIRTVSGEGLIQIGKRRLICGEGALLIARKQGVICYGTNGSRWHFYWFEFAATQDMAEAFFERAVDTHELTVIDHITHALSADQPLFTHSGFDYWLSRLLEGGEAGQPAGLAVRAARHIDRSPAAAVFSQAELAMQFGVSERTLRKRFIAKFGMTPFAYSQNRKLKIACALLNTTDMKCREIAEKTGCANEYYFSRQFKQHTGLSPTDYRGR